MLCFDDVVCCVLWVKVCVGFFDFFLLVNCSLFGDKLIIGYFEYCVIVCEVVCKLLVMLKNNDYLLLFELNSKVLVVGDGVYNIGK